LQINQEELAGRFLLCSKNVLHICERLLAITENVLHTATAFLLR